jgi:hypothetical protein
MAKYAPETMASVCLGNHSQSYFYEAEYIKILQAYVNH